MNPLLSIIVPAYNAEKYLRQCLLSLSRQSYDNLEIICIDDGSTDSTLQIMNRTAEQDRRFKIISSENRGYGAACNIGLRSFNGKYVTFLESDDYCDKDYYERMIAIAERFHCDFVKSDFYITNTAGDNIRYKQLFPDILYNKILLPRMIIKKYNLLEVQPSIWSAIYSSTLINDNEIRFLETQGAAFQDTSFSVKTILLSKRAYFMKNSFVYYRQHPEQSTKSFLKPFAIIEEYAEIERNFPMTAEIFSSKFHSYLWNYRRLGFEYKLSFLMGFADEFKKLITQNPDLIDSRHFRSGEIEILKMIFNEPNKFHDLYSIKLDYTTTLRRA